jgi:hypothetical protein
MTFHEENIARIIAGAYSCDKSACALREHAKDAIEFYWLEVNSLKAKDHVDDSHVLFSESEHVVELEKLKGPGGTDLQNGNETIS